MKKRFEVAAAKNDGFEFQVKRHTVENLWVEGGTSGEWDEAISEPRKARTHTHTQYKTRRQQRLKNDTQMKFLRDFFIFLVGPDALTH